MVLSANIRPCVIPLCVLTIKNTEMYPSCQKFLKKRWSYYKRVAQLNLLLIAVTCVARSIYKKYE